MRSLIFVALLFYIGHAVNLVPKEYSMKLTVFDSEGNYPVEMKIDTTNSKNYGFVSYPTYDCSGYLVLKKLNEHTIALEERITKGADICANGEYSFSLMNHQINKPKDFILESQKYQFQIKDMKFKADSWLMNNCYKLNNELDSKSHQKTLIDYDTLDKCMNWSKKYTNKYNLAYEQLLVKNISTVKQAQQFLSHSKHQELIEIAKSKLENIYFQNAITIDTINVYISKYPSGKYINQLTDKKIRMLYLATNNSERKLEEFVKMYPNSEYTNEAMKKLALIDANRKEQARLAELEKQKLIAEQKAIELEKQRLVELQQQRELERIKRQEEKYALAFKQAIKENTIESYNSFIKQYPNATEVVKAKEKIQEKYRVEYQKVEHKKSYKEFEKFISEYPNAPQKSNAKSKMYQFAFKKVKADDSVEAYQWFIDKYPSAPQIEEAMSNMYSVAFQQVKKEKNIAGYEWFIESFPNSPQIKEAFLNLHVLVFDKAKNINTIESYNTFIIAYPTAQQVSKANSIASNLEKDFYNSNGLFKKNEEIDRNARKLLIAAKKIERKGNEYSGQAKFGYMLIVNRMYKLLETEFDESEATLRHLESLDFKDFTRIFQTTMNQLNNTLQNINRNTYDLIQISKQAFADAQADRQMAAHKKEEKVKWDKFMHFRDKGYM